MTRQPSELPLLLEPETLNAHLGDEALLIVDLSKAPIYQQAHIPGAVHLDFRRLQHGAPPVSGLIPPPDELEALFSELGLTPDTHVVACDDEGGGWAARLLWLLEIAGHQRYSYLNGGIHAWLAEGLPTDSQPVFPRRTEFKLGQINLQPTVDIDHVLKRHRDPDVVLWDARSLEEYEGTRAYAPKSGHIPGAVHFEWTDAMDKARNLRLRDSETLRRELAERGITGDKEVIAYCQTHHRSSLAWLVGRILGFDNIRGYPGSWSEWGNHPDTPAEKDMPA
ncbi:MAG: thiosulfate sulfurtransferase [Alcanivorax sp.]|nr:thiosulfate sulfurtransferase [Alcanivorax sp.]